MNVQTWIADETAPDQQDYEIVTCPACTQLHFINRADGKLFGADDE